MLPLAQQIVFKKSTNPAGNVPMVYEIGAASNAATMSKKPPIAIPRLSVSDIARFKVMQDASSATKNHIKRETAAARMTEYINTGEDSMYLSQDITELLSEKPDHGVMEKNIANLKRPMNSFMLFSKENRQRVVR